MSIDDQIKRINKTIENLERRIAKLEGHKKRSDQQSTAKKKKESISDHLRRLKTEGFFDKPKLSSEMVAQLATDGFHYPPESLTWALQKAVQLRELGRIKKEKKWAYCKR
jgi:hypothetical protein